VGESAAPLEAPWLPTGTVTFLFTDLEGSTRLLTAHPEAYREAVRRHHHLLREAVEGRDGAVFETVGDAVHAAVARPAAVAAALAGQGDLHREDWGATGSLLAMGLHLGESGAYPVRGAARGARCFGLPLARCARLTATAHGRSGRNLVRTGDRGYSGTGGDALGASQAGPSVGGRRWREGRGGRWCWVA
jgi:class 3 adenylate cyclase